MKNKFFLPSLILFLIASVSFAQKKTDDKSIINYRVVIKKYHKTEELERMPKGELLKIYEERTDVLVRTLPYIAFATKPGVTMTTLGIPDASDNKKLLDTQHEALDKFLIVVDDFQSKILPYSDTSKLISAIIFYEEILKSLHTYSSNYN